MHCQNFSTREKVDFRPVSSQKFKIKMNVENSWTLYLPPTDLSVRKIFHVSSHIRRFSARRRFVTAMCLLQNLKKKKRNSNKTLSQSLYVRNNRRATKLANAYAIVQCISRASQTVVVGMYVGNSIRQRSF